MFHELQKAEARFDELESLLADPQVIKQDPNYQKYLKEHGSLSKMVAAFRVYKKARQNLEDSEAMAADNSDPDMADLAQSEIPQLKKDLQAAIEQMKMLIMTKEDDGDRNVIMEFRAGTGGDESAIFVGDLVRMYQIYSDHMGWKMETLECSPSEKGGYKELVMAVSGEDVYAQLKYESGTHRVQRVPETETQGRIHTSAATIAVLPEVEDIEINIRPDEIKKDTYCSSGPGGQSVNTTYSAIRLTHLPTGLVVTCQDEKSQIKNTDKAMRVLRSRLYDHFKQIAEKERTAARRGQIGSGDRSERIRTYNFPQNRLTDHRINLTLYNLSNIVRGEIGPVIQALMEEDKKKRFGDLY